MWAILDLVKFSILAIVSLWCIQITCGLIDVRDVQSVEKLSEPYFVIYFHIKMAVIGKEWYLVIVLSK